MDASAGPAALSGAPTAQSGPRPDARPPGGGIVGLPATELAARVRSGELTAVEVVRAHLAHLAEVDARIGAFRVVRTEAALAEAAAVDASPRRAVLPLAGVPIAMMDDVAVTGEVATTGSAAHTPPPTGEDHPVVARLAGADADATALGLDRAALEPRSRVHARLGRWARRAGLVRPRTAEAFRRQMGEYFDDVDVLLTPVVAGPPLPARPWHERGFLANTTANARWAPWTPAWNLAGLPALVLPAGPGREGLPTSVQLVGPAGAETRLLWLAGELGARLPWRRHAPVFDPTSQAAVPTG